ncbi:tRNA pseudouridine(55) synthase TruB [Chloroflexota bacterium]
MHGILNVNKPQGITSFGIVAIVRRLSGEQRVGHAGTLDSPATGVLPICIGQGTRVVEFLVEATKTYYAQIELGVATDTYDSCGKITQQGDPSDISRVKLDLALNSFRGLIQQTPPMYSALKYHGKSLYQLARAGINIERESRPRTIHRLELIDWKPPIASVEVECDKGTYIRSIAHDLGQVLGCGGNLKNLIRLKYGPFDINDAVSVPQLEDAFRCGYWQKYIYPIDIVLSHYKAVIVNNEAGCDIRNGKPIILGNDDIFHETDYLGQNRITSPNLKYFCRAYTDDGCFLGILHFNPEKGHWQPKKVFPITD